MDLEMYVTANDCYGSAKPGPLYPSLYTSIFSVSLSLTHIPFVDIQVGGIKGVICQKIDLTIMYT